MTRRAALYLRISKDRTGEGLGVERQRADCEALAERLGWTVVTTHIDNDISAYSGKRRPGYEALLGDLKAGRVDAVIAWHPDRLHRRPIELEGFIDAVEAAGAEVATVTAGGLDLSTPSGRMVARMLGAAARHEVEHAQERMPRKQEQMRAAGEPHRGARPFGYRWVKAGDGKHSRLVVEEREADELRAAAAVVLVGQSPAEVARDWNARGVLTSTGKRWTGVSVTRVLTRPRNAALVEHYGSVTGQVGSWPAILDTATYEGVRAVLGDGITPTRPQAPRVQLLLSGVARCWCGATIMGAGSNESGRRYRCATGRHITRLAADLDRHVERAAVQRLADPDAIALVTGDRAGLLTELHSRSAASRARLTALGEMFGAGDIDELQLRAGSKRIKDELAEVDERLAELSAGSVLDGLAGMPDAGKRWQSMAIDRKRAAIDALMSITLQPGKRGGHGGTRFDPATVTIEWKRLP